MDYKMRVLLDWFDLDDLPALREYADEFSQRFSYSGLHTGSIVCEGLDMPTEDGEMVLRFGWVDLDDVPGLVAAVEREFGFDGENTGGIAIREIEFS